MHATYSHTRYDKDPLTLAIAPPDNESPQAKEARLSLELEAKRRSDAIDEEIDRQRAAEKKGNSPVKVLLLGQSESGKSTTLKNFQLMYSQKAFRAELPSWRAVIQLNIVRSIRLIIETLSEAQAKPGEGSSPSPPLPPLTPEHMTLKMRLSPLLQIEETLTRKLTSTSHLRGEAVDYPLASVTNGENVRKEISVHSRSSWKLSFKKPTKAGAAEGEIDWDDPQDPGRVIHACRDDMINLWNDPVVKAILKIHKLRVEEMGGFFLDDIPRVAAERYVPTNDDILRSRLKTVGVTEHRFNLKDGDPAGLSPGLLMGPDLRVFDVGGHRSLVSSWVPFFDDMNAIIFLAPISCFDQVLAEDRTINRLEDSVQLWTSIVTNRLLSNTPLVLFLNKCDQLQAKLDSGIQFSKFIVSYGSRPNDFDSTSTYLKKKFTAIHKDRSPTPRTLYSHFTSVTDSNTASILRHVQDSVITRNLKQGGLIG